jgi:hypothetical protein
MSAPGQLRAGENEWAPLPKSGFLVGRIATAADVENGMAVFAASEVGLSGARQLPVQIPQYAQMRSDDGKLVPVVVVQAEEAAGLSLFGLRDFNDTAFVATAEEVILLGAEKPK